MTEREPNPAPDDPTEQGDAIPGTYEGGDDAVPDEGEDTVPDDDPDFDGLGDKPEKL